MPATTLSGQSAVDRTRRRFLASGLFAAARSPAVAGPAAIIHLAVFEGDRQAAGEIVRAFQAHFPSTIVHIGGRYDWVHTAVGIIVALGAGSFASVGRWIPRAPVLGLFLSRAEYRALRPKWLGSGPVGAIFAEAGPGAQFEVINTLFGRSVTTLAFVPEGDDLLAGAIQNAAAQNGQDAEVVWSRPGTSVVEELALRSDFAAVLATPDSNLFRPDDWRAILEATYRRGRVIVGYNPGMVRAGAIATAYADIEQVVDDAALVIGSISSGARIHGAYPRFWRVDVNGALASSLGFNSDAVDRLGRLGSLPP